MRTVDHPPAAGIVCFSSNDWDDIPSSKVHIMRALAKRRRVLVAETLGIRPPSLSRRHLWKIARRVARSARGARQVEENLWVWSPLAIPFHRSMLSQRINGVLVAHGARRLVRRLGFTETVAWSYVPTAADVVTRIGAAAVVYHCIDDYREFEAAPREAIAALETRMTRAADLTVVSSRRLFELRRRDARAVAYVPHGVDLEHFVSADREHVALPSVDVLQRPIAGFVGRIADWIDVELLEDCARALPRWSFVLVGPLNVDVDDLLRLPNVHWLGTRPYHEIPHYIARFDVCLAPFAAGPLVDSVNPLKVHEYLAAGKPVVSTPVPELRPLAHVVRIADASGFVAALEEEVRDDGPDRVRQRRAAVTGRSWEAIARRILELLAESRGSPGSAGERDREPALDRLARSAPPGRAVVT